MLKTKDIYMRMCQESKDLHCMTDEERLSLQAHLRKMYLEIEKVCDRHGLTVMAAYGTVLGAVRHKGFIPWDDDLDLYMPREDYDLLVNQYADELPSNLKIFAPNSKNGPIYRFAKIVDTATKFIMPVSDEKKESSGVFIDIFPLEYTSTNKLLMLIRRFWLSLLMYIASSVVQYEDKVSLYRSLMMSNPEARRNYKLRNAIGCLFSFMSSEAWFNYFDKQATGHQKSDNFSTPSGAYQIRYFMPIAKEMFLPVKKISFDDIEIYVPNQLEKYLEMEYGNWREIPKNSDRWQHFIQSIKI